MTPDELRARRKALGMTQGELAQHLEVHWVTVQAWETGRRPIVRPKLLDRMLTALERQPKRRKTTR